MKKLSAVASLIPAYLLLFAIFIGVGLFGNKSITTLNDSDNLKTRTCIIIDPGHGGVDGGATSCNGIPESDINLQISHRLNDLMRFIGLKTVMIRQTDRSVYTQGNTIAQKKISDLKERVRIVNETENALLVSVHQNHFSDSRYYGPQVFYGKTGESKALAQRMQTVLTDCLCPESKRKAKQSYGVYLMDHINCEGVLIECGFLSNYEEEARLRDAEYQKKLCSVIAIVCADYINKTSIT